MNELSPKNKHSFQVLRTDRDYGENWPSNKHQQTQRHSYLVRMQLFQWYNQHSITSIDNQDNSVANSMKKSDKKTENLLIKALKNSCETAQDNIEGFQWLTHFVSFSNFPKSLLIVCIFDTNENRAKMTASNKQLYLHSIIEEKLSAVGIHLKDIQAHLKLDTEEDCSIENNGKWNERFKTIKD